MESVTSAAKSHPAPCRFPCGSDPVAGPRLRRKVTPPGTISAELAAVLSTWDVTFIDPSAQPAAVVIASS